MPIQQMLLGAGGVSEVTGQFMLTGDYNTYSGGNSYSWTVPDNVNSISVVCIGGGGTPLAGTSGYSSAGGGLAYANNIPVTPGASLTLTNHVKPYNSNNDTVISGPASGSQAAWSLTAGCGYQKTGGDRSATGNPGSVTSSTPPGGNGGSGYDTVWWSFSYIFPGGGGAGGYGSNGGNGGYSTGCSGWGCTPTFNNGGTGGNGGGGGGGHGIGGSGSTGGDDTGIGGGGGGTAPYGQGANGSGGASSTSTSPVNNGAAGQGGSPVAGKTGGTPANNTNDGYDCWDAGIYGGGAGTGWSWHTVNQPLPTQGGGCIRIIWPGDSRQFPSTRTADE